MERIFTEHPELTIREKFILSRWCYSLGLSVISDAEYTRLLDAMNKMYPHDDYCNRSWSDDPCPTELLTRLRRPDLIKNVVLTDKTVSIESLNTDWEVKHILEKWHGSGTLSMKHDGWNIQGNYFNGEIVSVQTRGRSTDAMRVDVLKEHFPKTIPALGTVKVVVEATINKHNFAFCAKEWKNVSPRSAVSSVLARPAYKHLIDIHGIDIHGCDITEKNKFEQLRKWGFQTPAYLEVTDYQSVLSALKDLSEMSKNYLPPTDGVVFDGDGQWAIRLLAWEEPIYVSYVTGYLEQWKSYRISPSVLIHPILRGGTTQRQLSMTNWQRIVHYNLQKGSPVAFRIKSNATADFDEQETFLLHQQWQGRWEEFQLRVDEDERIKKALWQQGGY